MQVGNLRTYYIPVVRKVKRTVQYALYCCAYNHPAVAYLYKIVYSTVVVARTVFTCKVFVFPMSHYDSTLSTRYDTRLVDSWRVAGFSYRTLITVTRHAGSPRGDRFQVASRNVSGMCAMWCPHTSMQ